MIIVGGPLISIAFLTAWRVWRLTKLCKTMAVNTYQSRQVPEAFGHREYSSKLSAKERLASLEEGKKILVEIKGLDPDLGPGLCWEQAPRVVQNMEGSWIDNRVRGRWVLFNGRGKGAEITIG